MDDFSAPDLPGFTVGRQLGRGGSSTVWLVTEERTGRDFALKCLLAGTPREGQVRDAARQEAARREIQILSVLDHQHLIRAHDAVRLPEHTGDPDVSLGVLVDYASGGSLGQLVGSRGKLTVGETVTVLTPVAQVLGYLHGKGFTHSDVSPGNVLFTGHGKPMLADLGMARMVGDASPVPEEGTEGFMDPAPVDAVRAGLQPERDVYSVAALGWYCLTGEPPRRTAHRPPLTLLRPEVPAELAAALESGLNEDRRLRPTALDLAAAVYRSAAPLPVDLAGSVHPTVIPELLTRRRRPERSGGAAKALHSWHRRLSTSRWSAVVGARLVLPFPDGNQVSGKPPDNQGADIPPEFPLPRVARRPNGKHSKRPPHRLRQLQGKTSCPGPAVRPKGGGSIWGIVRLATASIAVIAGAVWLAGAFGHAGPWSSAVAGHHPAPMGSEVAGMEPQAAEHPEAVGALPGVTGSSGTDSGGPGHGGTAGGSADTTIPKDVTRQLLSADPAEAVHGLAWIRSYAFRTGQLELLDQVNAPGSAAFVSDERLKARLMDSGHFLTGFTSSVSNTSVQPESSTNRAVVTVTSATSAYQEKDQTGAIVATGQAAGAEELRLVLVSVDGRWRLAEILPGP